MVEQRQGVPHAFEEPRSPSARHDVFESHLSSAPLLMHALAMPQSNHVLCAGAGCDVCLIPVPYPRRLVQLRPYLYVRNG